MAGVHVAPPPAYFFKFPPANEPATLYPPNHPTSIAYPFKISPTLYNDLLGFQWPITIAVTYMTSVWLINRMNKRTKNKPWRMSKTRAFFYFVVAHNVFLALYSAWTTVGMFYAIRNSVPSPFSRTGLIETVDALCKLSGPRGIGDAVTFDPTNSTWTTASRNVKLLDNFPDPTDLGRMWNEGLGYYGWLFYLSKFYEVVDTFIILAKGKKSSFLQTYHHAGAMLCMWAGIRYMSPPIWLFVQINSFIHAIMYTYYTISALGIRVPVAFKQTLTTMQIIQISAGASYAFIHLVISYDIPIERPHLFIQNLSTAIPSAASSLSASASTALTTAGAAFWWKKLALRAVGEEGLAANVRDNHGLTAAGLGISIPASTPRILEETRWRWETTTVRCIDTSGEAFAIWLNIVYLLPLTALFVRFFLKSYIYRQSTKSGAMPTLRRVSFDVVKKVEREIIAAMSPNAKQVGEDTDSDAALGSSDPKHVSTKSSTNSSSESSQSTDTKTTTNSSESSQFTDTRTTTIQTPQYTRVSTWEPHESNGFIDTPSTAKPIRIDNSEAAWFCRDDTTQAAPNGSAKDDTPQDANGALDSGTLEDSVNIRDHDINVEEDESDHEADGAMVSTITQDSFKEEDIPETKANGSAAEDAALKKISDLINEQDAAAEREEAARMAEDSAAEAVRRAYEAAAAAERDIEEDSIVSIETMRTTESAAGVIGSLSDDEKDDEQEER